MASKWATPNALTTIFTAANMQGLAADASIISSAYDNSSNADVFADFIVAVMWQVAPSVGEKGFTLQILPSADGTNYPSQRASQGYVNTECWGCNLEVRGASTTVLEYLVTPILLIPPGSFKVVLYNECTKQVHTTDGTMFTKMRPIQMSTTAT